MLRIFISATLIFAPLTVYGQNLSETLQIGVSNNSATIQEGMNTAISAQVGSNNSALTIQSGEWNGSVISQIGSGFSKTIVQTGNYQGHASHQATASGYNGSFTSQSMTSGNGITSTTLEFELN